MQNTFKNIYIAPNIFIIVLLNAIGIAKKKWILPSMSLWFIQIYDHYTK